MTKNASKKKSELFKFFKFNICVIVTSLLDVVSYMIMLYTVFNKLNQEPLPDSALLSLLGIKYKGYLYAYLISTTIGYVSAYLINRKITFKSNVNPLYSGVLYFILAVINILISSYIGGVFSSFIKAKSIASPIIDIISKFIIINIPTIWTYPLERYVIQIRKEPMTRKIIIATDLDGTLLDRNSKVSQEDLDAIERIAKKGVTIVLNTGRTLYEIPKELRLCESIDYIIYSNGVGINHREKGMLKYNPIRQTDAKRIFDVLSEYETFIEIYTCGAPYVDRSKYSQEYFDYYRIDTNFVHEMYESRRCVDNLESLINDNSYKTEMFDVFFRYQNQREECWTRLLNEFDSIDITTSMDNNLEIIPAGVNKGSALIQLCEKISKNVDEVIVVGDSKNDVTAFNTNSKKLAVSNACNELKELADEIICSNEEHIMCYIEKEIL